MDRLAERLDSARAERADAAETQPRLSGEIDAVMERIERTRERIRNARSVFVRLRLRAELAGQQAQLNLLRSRQSAVEDRIAALNQQIEILLVEQTILDTLGDLPSTTLPVALLPVRLETVFVNEGGSNEGGSHKLLLRVYPDDIHLDSHEPELTEDEERFGKLAAALAEAIREVTRLGNQPHPDLIGARVRAGNARTVIQRLQADNGRVAAQRSASQRDVRRFRDQLASTKQELTRVQNVMRRLETSNPPRSTVHLLPQLRRLETDQRNQQTSLNKAQRRVDVANTRLQQIPGEINAARTGLLAAEREIQNLEDLAHPDLAQAEAAEQALRIQHEQLLDAHRERFLFADGANRETMEAIAACNVVDGLALLEMLRDDVIAFGADNGLPAVGSDDHAALLKELAALEDTVDAASDLLTAESVHQLVGGNPLRAGESIDAVARGEMPPPEFEVIRTPRTGIAVTHRLLVLFGADSRSSSWPQQAHHVMATAEPRLDRWAGQLLGDPAKIRCHAQFLDPQSAAVLHERDVRLSELDRCALAVIYLAGDGEENLVHNLQAQLIQHLQGSRPVDVSAQAVLAFDYERQPDWAPEDSGLVEFASLATAVARCLLGARAIDGKDLTQNDVSVTANVDLGELRTRADGAVSVFINAHTQLLDLITSEQDNSGSVAEDAWRERLKQIGFFGIAEAAPPTSASKIPDDAAHLFSQALIVARQTDKRATQLSLLAEQFDRAGATEQEQQAHDVARLHAVFGARFRILPLFTPTNGAQLEQTFNNSLSLQAGDPMAAVTWFQRVAHVRDGARRFKRAMLFAEALSNQSLLNLHVGQLPHNADDRWVALPLVDDEPVAAGRLSLVAHMPQAISPIDSLAGIMIDEWTEVVPNALEMTGVAMHFDQPGTEPPQTVLLAVAPDTQMTWDIHLLDSIVRETLELAKLRTVDARMLADETDLDQVLPALYFGLNLSGDTVSTDFTRAATRTVVE